MRDSFNKTFTRIIYKFSPALFQSLKTIATLVNYTCKGFIQLTAAIV